MKFITFTLSLLTLLSAPNLWAKSPDNLESIAREIQIFKNVFASALNSTPGIRVRTSDIQAAYLADQGVVLSFNLYAPWSRGVQFNYNSGGIPELVHNVLADLQIAVSPYEPEALEELRALRVEQKVLREQDRSLRSLLRNKRREQARKHSMNENTTSLKEEIATHENELKGFEAEYRELAKDIDNQYAALREVGTAAHNPTQDTTNILQSVTQIVCDYGSTLKSLNSKEFINITFRHQQKTELLVYPFKNVKECQAESISVEDLLGDAYAYQL